MYLPKEDINLRQERTEPGIGLTLFGLGLMLVTLIFNWLMTPSR